MNTNAIQHYKEQSINTMTPHELLLVLFDELVKRLIHCELAIDKENWGLFEVSVDRSMDILRHLDNTLDRQYPISRELHRLYDFFIFELNRVKASRNKTELVKILPMITDLRETFREASKNQGKSE